MRAWLVLLLLTALPARADLAAVQARLAEAPVLSGDFTQRKTLTGLPIPLISTGRFLYWRGHGLHWALQEPVAASIRITPEALVQQEDGRVTLRVDAAEQPGFAIIAGLFFSLFELDLARLGETFAVETQQGADGWQLRLRPHEAQVAETVSEIIVSGDTELRNLHFTAPNGDVTDIALSQLTPARQPPPDHPLRRAP